VRVDRVEVRAGRVDSTEDEGGADLTLVSVRWKAWKEVR
jgi:hypothetical protein